MIYAVNWCVSRWNGRDTMDVIFFSYHVWADWHVKRCKSVDRTIFFLIQFFFLNIHLKLSNHRYFIIKNPLFFTIHNKNGVLLLNFKSKWPYHESDQLTGNPLFIPQSHRPNRHETDKNAKFSMNRPAVGHRQCCWRHRKTSRGHFG